MRVLPRSTVVAGVAALVLAACGGQSEPDPDPTADPTAEEEPSDADADDSADAHDPADDPDVDEPLAGTLRVYTSVTEDTVEAVLGVYEDRHPDVDVEVFRAPTGELSARLAAEQREGRIRADVLWLTDPLSMQQYDDEGLLRAWQPEEAAALPDELQQDTFWGTRILNLVIVHQTGLEPAPTSWHDLAAQPYEQPVAIPDPGFAGSAYGALAYFGLEDDFGLDYYEALADNGLVQVQAPGEVVTGVAEGRFAAGMSLDKVVRDAQDDGSPIELVAPEPGAIALDSPIAVVDATAAAALAESFVETTLTVEAQEAIAETGWQPARPDVAWPHDIPQVFLDWQAAVEQRDELLESYRSIVGG